MKIFTVLKENGQAVINGDDKAILKRAKALKETPVTRFGINRDNDISARDVSIKSNSMTFSAILPGGDILPVKTKLK